MGGGEWLTRAVSGGECPGGPEPPFRSDFDEFFLLQPTSYHLAVLRVGLSLVFRQRLLK